MIRANSRHVGSPSRSEREEFSRTSNWRSSLRSTKEQRGYENGNGFRSSLRSYTDKENQVKTKATRGEPKTPTKPVENPPAKEKKSEPKTDVANRAKKKFLEHLSKFQKESKATGFNVNRNNNFYRSYRKPNEDKESPGLRRSYRVPASKPSVKAEPTGISSNPVFKRPQRKDKTSESQIGGITKENTSKSVRSVKSESTSSIKYDSDHSSLDFSVKANVGSCNSSRPTSASSTVTSDSSRSASSGAKKSTRAELAMERHMDRMRKASQNSPTSNPPYNRSASSSKLRQKSTTEAERIDDVISPTRFTIPKETTTRQSNSNQDDKSLSELIDDWIIEGLSDTSFTLNDFASAGSKPKKSSTTSATEPGKILSPKPKSSTVIPEWNSVNIVEDDVFDVTASPLKKRDSASKIEVSTPHRKNSTSKLSSKTPVATVRSASKTSQGDVTPSDESALSHRLLTSQNSSDRLNKAGWNEKTEPDLVILETDELGTSPTASKIKHVTSKPPTPVKHGKAKSPAKIIESPTFSSGEPRLAKKRRSREQPTETEINYSVEEAIDTFRRLSEEIDSIKERGFRPSLLDSDRKPTSKKDKTRKVVSSTSPVKTVAPPIKSAPNSDSVATGAVIASGEPLAVLPDSLESSYAVATKPAPLEPEKVAATLQIASDKPAHDSKGALSAGRSRGGSTSQPGDAQEQGVGEKRTQRSSSLSGHKQEDQNSSIGREDVRLVRSNENNTVQPARSCTAEVKTVVATPQAEKNSNEAKTTKIKQTRQRASTLPEVMPNQPAKRTLSKAEKIQRLRIAVAKYSYTPASSDDESLISDGNGSDDEDPSWLNDSDTDSSLSSLGSVKKSKFVSSTASHANKKSDANGRQDLSEDSQASTRYNGANNDISTPESPKSAAHERPPVDNEKKVGAMLSMWENKKVKPKSAFDASEDDAFDNSTKGRLHGAKALFENMTKNPKTYSSSVENEIETTGITGSKKSLFENLAKSPQRAEPQTHSPKKPPSVHSSDYDVDDVISDASLSSDSSDEEEEKSEENKQDEKKEAPSVNNVRQMWERKLSVRVKKTPTKTRDPSLQEIVRSDSQHDDVVTSVRDVTAAWESGSKKAQR